MRTKIFSILIFLVATPVFVVGQSIAVFSDDFEDGSLDTTYNEETVTLWKADHPDTFGLSEVNGVLQIDYNRSANSEMWDNFNFTPPEPVNVAGNPLITMDIKSDVATAYSVKPVYSNGSDEFITIDLPGDNEWHTYEFDLSPAIFADGNISVIYHYFDGGSTELSSGTIQFDDLKIGGFSLNVTNAEATLVDSASVDLSWSVNEPTLTDHFNIYRSQAPGFTINETSKIGDTTATVYEDRGLDNFTQYYYLITAVDENGEEYAPSSKIDIRTYSTGSIPEIAIAATNTQTVGKYEKFEVELELDKAAFGNPYNPEEIDIFAYFKSPAGDTTWINGFYDNYENRDAWKVRFSPNQIGSYEFKVFAKNPNGTGESTTQTFASIDSDHKGWLRLSPNNSEYLMHDDSSSFYGISVYYPWNVNENKLDELVSYGANIFGYWNSTYDNAGNGGGRYLIESMDSGLGHYDQRKSARIDELLEWSEDRDLKIMLAIWAHDWLRVDNQPWENGRWLEENPYSEIVDVQDFYTDELAWSYQQKLYRYIIARWGYSRALGIWELINEIHGTTGFVNNKTGAKQWVGKINAYFQRNDPYNRPTTASMGEIGEWSQSDTLADIPNDHFYEQYDNQQYNNDLVRSGLVVATNRINELNSKGDRPIFFGEAGYYSMFTAVNSYGYTQEYHNILWAGVAMGTASTPFWWEYNQADIFTDLRQEQLTHVADFVRDINFAHTYFTDAFYDIEGADAYGLNSNSISIGWLRSHEKEDISETSFNIRGLSTGSYQIQWYNTWSGQNVHADTSVSLFGAMKAKTPELSAPHKDVAYKISPVAKAEEGKRLVLFFQDLNVDLGTGGNINIICYVADENGILYENSNDEIRFSLEGNGSLSKESAVASNGVVRLSYSVDSEDTGGSVSITAEATGLASASLNTMLTNNEEVGATLPTAFKLHQNYPNPFNPVTTISYSLSQAATVSLSIYTINGQKVATLVNSRQSSGNHSVAFDAKNLSSGVYFYRIETAAFNDVKRMILLK